MTSSERLDRLEQQLRELITVERPRLMPLITDVDGNDPADQADRAARELELAHLDARIQRLSSRLLAAEAATAADGAGPLVRGAVLVLDFGAGPETYRFDDLDVDEGLDVVTPDSPLGRALADAAPGQAVTYETPRGQASVTLLSVRDPAADGAAPPVLDAAAS
jgi:transcription elongation GreA/GreB family factor